jgi:hypothetical protein
MRNLLSFFLFLSFILSPPLTYADILKSGIYLRIGSDGKKSTHYIDVSPMDTKAFGEKITYYQISLKNDADKKSRLKLWGFFKEGDKILVLRDWQSNGFNFYKISDGNQFYYIVRSKPDKKHKKMEAEEKDPKQTTTYKLLD